MSRRSKPPTESEGADTVETPDADSVAEMVEEGADESPLDASRRLDDIRERIETLVVSRPLLTLGVAVGIGFVLARLIRR